MQLFALTCLLCAVVATVYGQAAPANPEITSVTTNATSGSYTSGQSILISVVFNENITVVPDTPNAFVLLLNNGDNAGYVSGSGTNTLNFIYDIPAFNPSFSSSDVQALDFAAAPVFADPTGVTTVQANATGQTAAGTFASIAGNATLDPFLATSTAVVIDVTGPVITSVIALPQTVGGSTYTIGQMIPVIVTFDEVVTVTGNPELHIGDLTFEYASQTANTVTFNYTVTETNLGSQNLALILAAATLAEDDMQIDSVYLSLNGGSITNGNGTNIGYAANYTLFNILNSLIPPFTGFAGVLFDDTLGSTGIIGITTNVTDGTSLSVGQSILISITFDRNISFVSTLLSATGSNRLSILLNNGGVAYLSAADNNAINTNVLNFVYTVASGDMATSDLEVASASALSTSISAVASASFADFLNASISIDFTLPTGQSNSKSLAAHNIAVIVGEAYITNIQILNSTSYSNVYFGVGNTLVIAVTFSESVNVVTSSRIALSNNQYATYRSQSSDGMTLYYTYTVSSSDSSVQVVRNTGALTLTGSGSINDTSSNNAANLTIPYSLLPITLNIDGNNIIGHLVVEYLDTNTCSNINSDVSGIENIVYNNIKWNYLNNASNTCSSGANNNYNSDNTLRIPVLNFGSNSNTDTNTGSGYDFSNVHDSINNLDSNNGIDVTDIYFDSPAMMVVPTLLAIAALFISLL